MPATCPTFEGVINFAGYHGSMARCHLRIFAGDPDRPAVVVASELEDNPGTSIVNACESLAAQVCRQFGIDPDCLLWVEHLPERPACHLPERFALVEFDRTVNHRPDSLGRPQWTAIGRERVEALIGRPFA